MKCPNDNTTLLITERKGIEIDYCPECRGVWLDRGELEKLISADEGHYREAPRQEYREERRHSYDDDHHYRSHDGYHHESHHKKHKKEGFLGDLFDF